MWFFASVCAVLLFLFCMALLYVRVHDTRRTVASNERLSERTSAEAMTVLKNNADLQLAAYNYGMKQADFGREVLRLFEQGAWKGEQDELVRACIRQLDGVPPPPHAPTMSVHSRAPRAEMPDLSGRVTTRGHHVLGKM